MFSEFVVYVDESGDHSLLSINAEYPLFVLSFCVFQKDSYTNAIAACCAGSSSKRSAADSVLLSEIDIRRKRAPFPALGKLQREAFLDSLTQIIHEAFTLIAVVIDKRQLKTHYRPLSILTIWPLEFGLERLYRCSMKRSRLNT